MRKLLLMLWRIWFYLLCTLPVLVLFIPLAFFVTIPNGYKYLYWIARNIWSPFVLFGMGFWIKRLNTFPPEGKSMVIVANHSSYMDIMLMFRMRKTPFVFVGKKELVKIPFFGYLYKRAAITVDRGSLESRQKVYESAHKVIEKAVNDLVNDVYDWNYWVLDEEFNETIKSRHRDEFNYHSFSEGEKLRIDLAILFTWRDIVKFF